MKLTHRLHKRVPVVALLGVALAMAARGQQANPTHKRFTNADVMDMVKLGLSEDVIVAKIRALSASGPDAVAFDTGVEALKALKGENVPDGVIKVMINPAPPPVAVVSGSTAVTMDPNLPPPEVGVYWKDRANFVLIQGQAVTNAKVGGKAGSFFTDGMRNQHWDATIEGPASKNLVRERMPTFYLYVPDGSDAGDYTLIKLNKKGDRREFQIGSFGGVTGGKSGVKKDKELAFKAEHVGIRTYKVTLQVELKPGEYGFFMGTGQSSTMSGARGGNRSGGAASGRIYDFSIAE
jgi:hypothetical protein